MSLAELEACVEEQKIKVGDPGYRFVQTFPTFKGKRGKEKIYLGTVKEILPDGRREIHYSDNDVRFLTLEDVELHSKNFFLADKHWEKKQSVLSAIRAKERAQIGNNF